MIEIARSINERSNIKAAMHKAKQDLKYYNYCRRDFKNHEDADVLIGAAERCLFVTYKDNLIPTKKLADKYYTLHGEEFFKLTLKIEKALNI